MNHRHSMDSQHTSAFPSIDPSCAPSLRIAIPGHPRDTRNYEHAISQAGAVCQIISDCSCLSGFDGLLLPGGGDIDPVLYGRKNRGSRAIDLKLDLLQLKAADYFLYRQKPILGICKGMQVIHVALGGSICQDIPEGPSHIWKNGDQYHSTSLLPDSFLFQLFHTSCLVVNSAHHQAIEPSGNGLRIIQYAGDGVPEGVMHESLPIIGLQWHPERMPFPYPASGTHSHCLQHLADPQLPMTDSPVSCSSAFSPSPCCHPDTGTLTAVPCDKTGGIPSSCIYADGAAIFQYFLSLCRCSDR